jgi:uncharacterized protein YqiB (DUF1249 family)
MVDKTRQAQPRTRQRKGYHIDLSDLHAQCEANYHRLMRLFPAYEQESQCVFDRYPNPDMLQRDEKFQQNRFAAELLEFCLNNGRSVDAVLPEADPPSP